MSRIFVPISPEIRTLFSRVEYQYQAEPDGSVEIDDVYKAVTAFNNSHTPEESIEIASLLETSEIIRRERSDRSMNLSTLTELEQMRLRAEERRYQRSIENVVTMKKSNNSDIRSMSESIAFASHFILAFGSAFLLGYYLGEYLFGFEKSEHKYMVGGACSFATLILESILFIIRDNKQNMSAKLRSAKPKPRPAASDSSLMTTDVTKNVPESVRKRN
jgi:hypothetical protein